MDERLGMMSSGELADEGFRPYRHLAFRVLALALADVRNPHSATADRESARAFLHGSQMLVHWCRVADLDPACVIRAAAAWADTSAPAPSSLILTT